MVKVIDGLCNETGETCRCSAETEFGVTFVAASNVLVSIGHLTFGGKTGINKGQ